jgi:hypothetical protein
MNHGFLSNTIQGTTLQDVRLLLAQEEAAQVALGQLPQHKISLSAFLLISFDLEDSQSVKSPYLVEFSFLMWLGIFFVAKLARIKACEQASSWLIFKTNGMHYIVLFKPGVKFNSFICLTLPPSFRRRNPHPRQQIQNLIHCCHLKSLLKTFHSFYHRHCRRIFVPSLSSKVFVTLSDAYVNHRQMMHLRRSDISVV